MGVGGESRVLQWRWINRHHETSLKLKRGGKTSEEGSAACLLACRSEQTKPDKIFQTRLNIQGIV